MKLRIKAIVLDRDGTLIEHVPYLCDPAAVRLIPQVREAIQQAHGCGIQLFLHTNQSGVGRGLYGLDAVRACNERMMELLDLGPALFRRICIAPESPHEEAVYRKPSPRFAHELMAEFSLDPREVCYIGDRGSDLQTALAAGTQGVGVATGRDDLRNELRELGLYDRFPVFDTLDVAVDHILGLESMLTR